MLSDRVKQRLAPAIKTLRIIVLALGAGVLSFAVIAAVLNADKPQHFGTKVDLIFLVISVPMFLAGFVVPRLMPQHATPQGHGGGSLKDEPEVADALGALGAIQASTIVGCAIFEGAAFMNLVAYFLYVEWVHVAVAGVCWMCIMAHFPVEISIYQRIEERLRRRKEAKGL